MGHFEIVYPEQFAIGLIYTVNVFAATLGHDSQPFMKIMDTVGGLCQFLAIEIPQCRGAERIRQQKRYS